MNTQPEVQPDEFVTLTERCQTCAYRPGTEANKCWRTQTKAKLCLETAEPFHCHEDSNRRALCRGWTDAMEARLANGNHGEQTPWRRALYGELANIITSYENLTAAGYETLFDFEKEMREAIQRIDDSEHSK